MVQIANPDALFTLFGMISFFFFLKIYYNYYYVIIKILICFLLKVYKYIYNITLFYYNFVFIFL